MLECRAGYIDKAQVGCRDINASSGEKKLDQLDLDGFNLSKRITLCIADPGSPLNAGNVR